MFACGALLSLVLSVTCASLGLFASSSDAIICFWGRTCDGGDLPLLYRVAQNTLIIADFPAYLLASIVPRADVRALYLIWYILLILGSTAWWYLIAWTVRRAVKTTKLAFVGVGAIFALAAVTATLLILATSHSHVGP